MNDSRQTRPETLDGGHLRLLLAGAAFVGVITVASLPQARGVGAFGWAPMWLVGMPLFALLVLAVCGRMEATQRVRATARPDGSRRRRRPQARRRRFVGRRRVPQAA